MGKTLGVNLETVQVWIRDGSDILKKVLLHEDLIGEKGDHQVALLYKEESAKTSHYLSLSYYTFLLKIRMLIH